MQSFAKPKADAKAPAQPRAVPRTDTRRQNKGYRPITKRNIPSVRTDTITSGAEMRGLAILQASLHSGVKPTNGFGGLLGDGNPIITGTRDSGGATNKYRFDYRDPLSMAKMQFHYSIDESLRGYYDVKINSEYVTRY